MGRWRAQCWLGSDVGMQELEVSANTYSGAERQLKKIYGAEQIVGLTQVSGGGSSGGDGETFGNTVDSMSSKISPQAVFVAALIAGGIYVFSEYTPWAIMATLGTAGFWIGKKFNNVIVLFALSAFLGAVGFYIGVDIQKSNQEPRTPVPSGVNINEVNQSPSIENTPRTVQPRNDRVFVAPSVLTKEEENCRIWKKAFPEQASKLKPGDNCY